VRLFERTKGKLADYERQRLLRAAFEQRELRLGRQRVWDPDLKEPRKLRRIDSHWGFAPRWVDAGPFDPEAWDRRFGEWLKNAAKEGHFDEDMLLGQRALGEADQKSLLARSLRSGLHVF